MTTVTGEAAPAAVAEFENDDPTIAGVDLIERLRAEQVSLIDQHYQEAGVGLSIVDRFYAGESLRETARQNAAPQIRQSEVQYARLILRLFNPGDYAEVADHSVAENRLADVLAQYSVNSMSDTEWYAGTQNPDDGSWSPSGQVRLREAFGQFISRGDETEDDDPEELDDETDGTDDEDDGSIIPWLRAVDPSEIRTDSGLMDVARHLGQVFSRGREMLKNLSLQVASRLPASVTMPASLSLHSVREYFTDEEKGTRRAIIATGIGALAAGALLYLAVRGGSAHVLAEAGSSKATATPSHQPKNLGAFNTGPSTAPQVHQTPAAVTPDNSRSVNNQLINGGRLSPTVTGPKTPQTAGFKYTVSPGEAPWTVLKDAGVPEGNIMQALEAAAKRSGLPYQWHGSGLDQWLEEETGARRRRPVLESL